MDEPMDEPMAKPTTTSETAPSTVSAPQKTTPASPAPPRTLPTISEPRAWDDRTATPEEAAAFAAAAAWQYFPAATPDVVRENARALLEAGYAADELRYAAAKMKHDEALVKLIAAKVQTPFFLLPAISRIITEARRLRRQLIDGLLSEYEVSEIIGKAPELRRADFHRAGFDYQDRPLYRYALGITPSREHVTMQRLHGRGNASGGNYD